MLPRKQPKYCLPGFLRYLGLRFRTPNPVHIAIVQAAARARHTRSSADDTLATMIADVAAALDHAHAHGVIHRDIKPANLLLSSDERLSVTDFGLARILEQPGMTSSGELLGSPLYMSPEQIMAGRAKLDHRTDVYSLGATLYECLTLHPPHGGKGRDEVISKIMHKKPKAPRKYDPKIPRDLETICLKAIERDPDHRYQTAAQMAEDLRRYAKRFTIGAKRANFWQRSSRLVQRHKLASTLTMGIIIAAAVAAIFGWQYSTQRGVLDEERWARTRAIPEILRLVEQESFSEALALAFEVEQRFPGDTALAQIWPQFSVETSIESDPPGIDVSIRDWDARDDTWLHIGTTPTGPVRLPKGHYHWKLARVGSPSEPQVLLRSTTPKSMEFRLGPVDETPPDMVLVSGGMTYVYMGAIAHADRLSVADYYIDRHEVTNAQFQEFVSRSGYETQKYWKHPFVEGAESLSWETAMSRFVDSTNEAGPAGWKHGHYPDGKDSYPVRGISWFEAAAYAEFTGKTLPSLYHWARAASLLESPYIVRVSNFENAGPSPIGHYRSVGGYGTLDMAGNVREWCANDGGSGRRFILGGAWNDSKYMFNVPTTCSPFSRFETDGFRCIKTLPGKESSPRIHDAILRLDRDFTQEEPVSEELFTYFLRNFSYDSSPLNEKILSMRESDVRAYEKIEFDTAYGERMKAHLYLPKHSQPPYQVVIYFPSARSFYQEQLDEQALSPHLAFLVESGRAVLYPVYKGTYERTTALRCITPKRTNLYREHVIAWSQDLGRSIDYLQTRSDVAHEKLAFYGHNWGAMMGAILPAVEKRLKVAVLSGGGFLEQRTYPEFSQINFAPRVTIPTLMLSGRYNFYFPIELAAEPMFRLLGTPDADKRFRIFESGNTIPQEELSQEATAWLDKYLGPVDRLLKDSS